MSAEKRDTTWSHAGLNDHEGQTSSRLTPSEVELLYRKYGALVLRRCRALMRHESAADDALQEVFVRMLRFGQAIREAEEPLRFIYRVTSRVCFDLLNHRSKHVTEQLDDIPSTSLTIHEKNSHYERDLAMRLLSTLSHELREIAVMAFVDEYSQDEIAQALGLARQTINRKIQIIKDKMSRYRARHLAELAN
jgi:RNA polymerase sigma-70 factor, ECF subfamily